MEKELTCLRSIIADCDERITAALKTRMECIEGIITYKRENGLPVLQPEQEKKQLERVAAEVAGTIFEEEILHIFEGIIENSKRIQAKTLFDKNILLIGFMGAGKSTVSAKLSELLAMEIMEMDAHIQEKEGMSIKEIFAVNGEEYFRNCESNTLIELREKKAHGCLLRRRRTPQREKRGADEKQRLCGLADGNARSHLRKSKGQHGAPSAERQYECALYSKPYGKPQRKIRKSGGISSLIPPVRKSRKSVRNCCKSFPH